MAKLVRDGTEAALAGRNPRIAFDAAPSHQRTELTFAKLLEEAGEWLMAEGRDQRLKELGDLQEVVWALGEVDGISETEIAMQATEKRRVRGGFSDLCVMRVEADGDTPRDLDVTVKSVERPSEPRSFAPTPACYSG